MLNLLLERINSGGTYSLAELANELGTSQTLVEQMVAQLVRMGYLKPVDGCVDGKCPSCSASCNASSGSQVLLWTYESSPPQNQDH